MPRQPAQDEQNDSMRAMAAIKNKEEAPPGRKEDWTTKSCAPAGVDAFSCSAYAGSDAICCKNFSKTNRRLPLEAIHSGTKIRILKDCLSTAATTYRY
jgi:hypothetical protein